MGNEYNNPINKRYNGILNKTECLTPNLAENFAANGVDIAKIIDELRPEELKDLEK